MANRARRTVRFARKGSDRKIQEAAGPINQNDDRSEAREIVRRPQTSRVPARVEPVKNAKDNRITHRIPIESIDQVDGFVEKWLRTVYEADK